jgi:dipeptidyl aminopeptidase/acylaminoacyl peptidase
MESDISTVPADSGKIKTLANMKGEDSQVRYAPDGKTIAFASCGDKKAYTHLDDVYVIPAAGGTPRKLAHTPNRYFNLIGWTEDSKEVLVTEAAKTSWHIYAVPSDGDPVRQISKGKGLYGGYWIRPSISPASNKLAFVYQNEKKPYEVYTSSLNEFDRQRITSINQDAPKPKMGKTELITWRGPGNRKIEGLLTYPPDYQKGEQVPLILYVHGGPNAAHNRSFTGSHAQLYAGQGFAVLRPNPLGSDGYGQEFRQSVTGNWGPGPLKDLMAGVDKTIEMSVAHPDSLVIMGASYGGYMTAYAVTQTDRFGAASMLMGVSNLISDIGTSDVPDRQIAQMGGPYWNNMETYIKNSPIYHVGNVSTPTLVMHGAKDKRVPVSQGWEFYRALKRQDVDTEMIIFPRMAHGWNEPKYLIQIADETIDWFDEQLGRDQEASDSE